MRSGRFPRGNNDSVVIGTGWCCSEKAYVRRFLAGLACAWIVAQATAFAHEAGEHPSSHGPDSRMLILHKIMPIYAGAEVKIDEALKKRDAAAVESETGKILKSIPDLKRAKPHKNLDNLSEMRKIASAFEREVRATVTLAKKGEFSAAVAAFAGARKMCDECHAKFR